MPTKEEISAILPDYVRGELSDTERARVEAAVSGDPELEAELAVMQSVSNTLKSDPVIVPDKAFGWAKLSRAVDAAEPANDNSRRLFGWQFAASVFAVLAIGQAVMLTLGDAEPGTNDRFTTVSEEPMEARSLQVTFVPTASENDIRALLNSIGAEITAGPSALGVYRITISQSGERDSALKVLSDRSDIVEGVF